MEHLTQEELAELTDFSVSQIRRLETGRTLPSLEVLCLLCALWLEVCRNIQLPSGNTDTIIGSRMQKFLQYISEHYGEEISLDKLAGSANVSKSECLRCFKTSMQTTPYKYLTEYRLSKATELLKNSDEPIGNIADSVGFRQISHFGKCFKEKTGLSPRDYRKKSNACRT